MRAIGAQFGVQNIQRLSEMLDVATLSCGSISFVFDIAININCRVNFLPRSLSCAHIRCLLPFGSHTHVTSLSLWFVCECVWSQHAIIPVSNLMHSIGWWCLRMQLAWAIALIIWSNLNLIYQCASVAAPASASATATANQRVNLNCNNITDCDTWMCYEGQRKSESACACVRLGALWWWLAPSCICTFCICIANCNNSMSQQ